MPITAEHFRELVARNPRVDAGRAQRLLEYLDRLQQDGIDLTPTYGISHPFATMPEMLTNSPKVRNKSERSGSSI
jgi:hypothetical protein